MIDQIEHFNQLLKQEQQRNASLKTEIKNLSINNRELFEVKFIWLYRKPSRKIPGKDFK